MLEHEIKMLEKLENTPSKQSKTEVRQKSVCLKTSRFKLSCFAQTLLRLQIRESFSGETRNLFYTPQTRTCFSNFSNNFWTLVKRIC